VDFRAMHRWASSPEPRSAELGPIAIGTDDVSMAKEKVKGTESDRQRFVNILTMSQLHTISTCEGMRHLTGNVGLN